LASSSHQTLASDLRQLVDASELFRHRLNNTEELRMLSSNVTTPIRPDTLGDIHDQGILKVHPDERNRTIPGEYVSLIIPGRNGASTASQSGPLTYQPIRHSAENDTIHDLAPVNQTVNNGTFTLIPFDPDEGDLPYGSGWLAGHLSFFYQLGEALRLALGLAPEEDANAAKNRIRTELGLPRYYSGQGNPGQDRLPLPVVNPRQVILKETLPVQVRFNQTTATDSRKPVPLAVTGYGSLGRYLKLTAEPDRNGTYRLQLAAIGIMTADGGLLPPSLWHRYPALTRPATGHRVRRSDSESAPVAGSDFELMNQLIPDVITFYREFAPLLHYHRAVNADFSERFEDLFRAFKVFDGYRRVNSSSTFALAVKVYKKLIDLTRNYPMKGEAGEKFAKLTTNFRRWLDVAIKPVPEKLHFVSIGPTVAELNTIRLWIAANSKSDLQINLWYDQNAMLATLLSEALKKAVTSQLTRQSGPGDPSNFESDLTRGIMQLQDQAWKSIASDMEQGRGFDLAVKNFLVGHLNYKSSDIDKKKAQMMTAYRRFKKKIASSYPGAKFSYEDINKVWTDTFGKKGKEAESYYLRELGLRGHLPAAIALVKTRVIDTLGGVCSDTKLSPAINEDLFKEIDHSGLIKTDWDRIRMALTELVIRRFGREFLPEDQDPAIEQKVSDDLVWFGEKYPEFKGDIVRSLTNSDPSQLFKPLGEVKVIPSEIYLPLEKAPSLFFAASQGSKTMQMVQNHLLTAYQTIDQYKLFDVTDWKTIEDTRTFFTSNQIAFPSLICYRVGGISTFAVSYEILSGNNALEQSNSAMGWTGDHRDSLDIPELSSSEYYTISSEALAVWEHENDIAVNTNTDPQSRSQYSQQLVIQMEPGDDSPIARASRYLFRKYNNGQLAGGSYRLVIDNDAWSDGETGAKVNKIDIGRFLDSESRIHVVGLGDSGNGEFTLSGQTALELSKKINALTGDTPVKTINLVGSGIDDNGLVSDYLKEILKTTKTSAVTARDGLLRVDIWGRLWVGLVSETDPVTWSLADHSDKLKARRKSNGEITVERWSEKDTLAEGATGLRRLPSVLSQDSGLLGPTVNPDDLVPTLAMFRHRLKPGLLSFLKPSDLEALETKIAEFDQLRQKEGSESALKKYMLVYRMQKNLPAILSGESAASHLAAAINQYLLDALVEVPEKLNFIWIGRLNEGVKDHLRVWSKMVPSWSLRLWYDPQAFLAPVLTREIYKAVADEKIAESFLVHEQARVEFLTRLRHLQDLAYSTIKKGLAQGKTFDDMAKIFLVNHLGMDQEELTQIQRQSLQEFTDLANELTGLRGNTGSGGFMLADINQLWHSGDETSMKALYVRELGLRGILAAASDLVRVVLLKGGGVYLDVDTLPHYNEKLFKGIEIPSEILHSGRLSHLINHMIMDYFADPGPEQLFFNRTPDPEIRREYNRFKEIYPDFFKAVKEAIVNHGKEPLFTFPGSVKAIPGSIEIRLQFVERINGGNCFIIAPPDSEVLKAVHREIIRRYKLIDRLGIGDTENSYDDSIDVDTVEQMKESIVNELGINNDFAKDIINYRGDGLVVRGAGATLHLSGPSLFIKVIRRSVFALLPEEDLFDYKLKAYFTQINPLARIDSVSVDTDEKPSSWITNTDKIVRYKLTNERDSSYKNQVILQLGNSDNEARASSYLRNKYQPDFSRLIRLMPDGSLIDEKAGYIIESRVVKASFITDDTRIIVVGHGSKVQDKKTGSGKFLLGGKTVEQLAEVLERITGGQFVRTVSLVGCGADASGEHYPVEAFARTLFAEIRTERITVRNALVAVDMLGRKWTGTLPADGNILWSQSDHRVKLVLEKDGRGQLMARQLPVAEGLVKKLHNLPALPPGRDYAYLGKNDRHFDQARRLLLETMIENNGRQKLSDLIEHYNRRLYQNTGDDLSPYRLMPLPVADVELPLASKEPQPEERRQISAFVRADSIGDPFSGVGQLAYDDPLAQENFARIQQEGYLLAMGVANSPSEVMAALFTRLLLGSVQDIVAPGGNDIDPFRVSSLELMTSVLGKGDLQALRGQQLQNDFADLSQWYIKSLKKLLGHFLADKADEKIPRLNARERNEQGQWLQKTLSLGINKRVPHDAVGFTDPVTRIHGEAFDDSKYLPVVTDPSGVTYVLLDLPESNNAAFPDNLRNILFMLQSSGPLGPRNAQTLINTIELAYSRHSDFLAGEQLAEKITRLPMADVVTLATEVINLDTEPKALRSLIRRLLIRLAASAVTALDIGHKPDYQQKFLIAELLVRAPEEKTFVVLVPESGKYQRTITLDPLKTIDTNDYRGLHSRVTLGARSPLFISTIQDSTYRSQVRELLKLNGMPKKQGPVFRYFDKPNQFVDTLLAWRKWEIESGFEAKKPNLDILLEQDRFIQDSEAIVHPWQSNKSIIVRVGVKDVPEEASDARLARVLTQSYGMALCLRIRAMAPNARYLIGAMEIWQMDYRDNPEGDYGFDNALTLRQFTGDPLYRALIRDSKNHDLKFAVGSVDDFQRAMEVLDSEGKLSDSVSNVISRIAMNPATSVNTFVEALVKVYTNFWKEMQDAQLRSVLQLQASQYQILKQRLTSSDLTVNTRSRLLSSLGNMENPPDKTSYTGTMPSHYMDVYSKGIKENSPGIISEVTPGSYGDNGSQTKVAILFSAGFIKYVRDQNALEQNAPSEHLFSIHSKIIKSLRWLSTVPEFKVFSGALAKDRSQAFGDLQKLVDQGVIDGSAGSGFDQVKIPDSVRLLLVITPPDPSGTPSATEMPQPVLVKNTGCVLKVDPSQYFIKGQIEVEQHQTLSGLIARYIVASGLLKGINGDYETLRKKMLRKFGIKALPEKKSIIVVPFDPFKGRAGLEIENLITSVDTEARKNLAYSQFNPDERINSDFPNILLSTDSHEGRTIIEIVTGPKPLSAYLSESSDLFLATKTLASVLANIPEGGVTVSGLVEAYNDQLLGNNPEGNLKNFKLSSFDEFKDSQISLLSGKMGAAVAAGAQSPPYRIHVNIGVDLSLIGDITSYIPDLFVSDKSDTLRQVFEWSQYKAAVISEKLNLNSDLLKSMFTMHLYKQALDSSTNNFKRGKMSLAGTSINKLRGLLRLGTADFLMTAISESEAEQLKTAIQNYGWQSFTSLMQETVNDLATVGSEAEGIGREWKVPEQRLQARLKLLFTDMLDHRVEHGAMIIPYNHGSDFFELPQGENKSPKLGYVDITNASSRHGVTSYVDEEGQAHFLGTVEVRKLWPNLDKMAFSPPDSFTVSVIKSVQTPGLLGADPEVDGIFLGKAQSLVSPETKTSHFQSWVKQSILDRLGRLSQAKLEHVTRSFVNRPHETQDPIGQERVARLLLTANLRAITGGSSGSAWDTLVQLQKIVSVDLQRITSEEQPLPVAATDRQARWQQLAELNLSTELNTLLKLFSGDESEGFIKPVLKSGEVLSGYGMSLRRVSQEITIVLNPHWHPYQSQLNKNPLTLTVGIKDATQDNHKATPIGKLFAIALLNHPDVAALHQAQKDLRAIWGLSSIKTDRNYGLTKELTLAIFPEQQDALYTQFVDGIGNPDHNWQFASGSVEDFARVLYGLSTRYDQDSLTEAFHRIRNYHRQNTGVYLDTFASAVVKTHRNLPDGRAALTLRQVIGSDGCTFLKQTLNERRAPLISGLDAIIDARSLDALYSGRDLKRRLPGITLSRGIMLRVTPEYFGYAGANYHLLPDAIRNFLATPLGKDYLKKFEESFTSGRYQYLIFDAPKASDGKQQIVVTLTLAGEETADRQVIIDPSASQKIRLSSLIPVFVDLVKSGYDMDDSSQPAAPDDKDIETRVRQEMGLAPLVQLAKIAAVKKDSATGQIVLERVTDAVSRPAGWDSTVQQSLTEINGSPLTTLKWLGAEGQPGLQLVTAPLSPDDLDTHRLSLAADFYALDKMISTLTHPDNTKDYDEVYKEYFSDRSGSEGQPIDRAKTTDGSDTGIILRLPFEDLDRPVFAALFADSDSPEGERLLASLKAAKQFVTDIAPASGDYRAIHAQLRSLLTLLLYRLSRDAPHGKSLFPGIRLADYIHTCLSNSAAALLSDYIHRVGLQQVTQELETKLTVIAKPGAPDLQAGLRIKDLLGMALDYRLANGAMLLPGTLPDYYSLPLKDNKKYRELWTGQMSEDSRARPVSRNADGQYLLDLALPGQSGMVKRLLLRNPAPPDNLRSQLRLALKPDWLGSDPEVTRAFLELAMSGVGKADWPQFLEYFSSLPQLQRSAVVVALGQYRLQYPEDSIKQLALALTRIQLSEVNQQISQDDQDGTPPAFRIRRVTLPEDGSHGFRLETDEGIIPVLADSPEPVTGEPSLKPYPQGLLMLASSYSSQFPGSFLDTHNSVRLYRQAMQDRQLHPDRYQHDVQWLIKTFSDFGPEIYRQRLQEGGALDLSAGRPLHWQLNPHIPLQKSRLQVGDAAVTIEFGMKDNPLQSYRFFNEVVGRFYAMGLAKSVEAVDASLFQSVWPEEAERLRQLGDTVDFDSVQRWDSLPAARHLDNTLPRDNSPDLPKLYAGSVSQEGVKRTLKWLFDQKPGSISLGLEQLFDQIQGDQDNPAVQTFAEALYEFDRNLPDGDRVLFREAFTPRQIKFLKGALTHQAPQQWELIDYIDTLKTTFDSQAQVTDADGFKSSTYRLVESGSGDDSDRESVVVIEDPEAQDNKRCRRGVDGCSTRLLSAGNLADR
ncbi:TcdA/TcdB catalytic glycosyltransferase domain-containing protein, partial [Endozoicomonas sp. ALB122]